MASTYTDASGVFINKLGITDAAVLKHVEYEVVATRSREILEQNAIGRAQSYNLERLQAVHKHLFQGVYEWAGKTRTMPVSKRLEGSKVVSDFAHPDTFTEKWQALEKRTDAFVNARGLAFEQKTETLAGIFAEANHIHPFPEGNGRSLQVFMQQLAHEQGMRLDYSKTTPQEWNRASAISGEHFTLFEHVHRIRRNPDQEPIKRVFAEIARPSRERELRAVDLVATEIQRNAARKGQTLSAGNLTQTKQSVQAAFERNPQAIEKVLQKVERAKSPVIREQPQKGHDGPER